MDLGAYLARIEYDGPVDPTRDVLEALVRHHLTAVPFENLDVYEGVAITTELASSIEKIVDQRRGGWCFELNGAFSALLNACGFEVAQIGAAVLLAGPSATIDHLTLEVRIGAELFLVDVGFGNGFITPLRLNEPAPQDGGNGTYQFFAGAQGTTLTRLDDDVPVALYRFRRVNLSLDDFTAASDAMQADKSLHWHMQPKATRLIDGGPGRVTLAGTQLTVATEHERTTTTVDEADVASVLLREFGIAR